MPSQKKVSKKRLPLRYFVKRGIYSSAYLSNLVQRKKLKAKKIGRNYFTTEEWFNLYLEKHGREKNKKRDSRQNKSDSKLLPLRHFAKRGIYSLAYLSNLVQRKKLKAKKIGRNYFTTEEWFGGYLEKHGREVNISEDGEPRAEAKIQINIDKLSDQIADKVINIVNGRKSGSAFWAIKKSEKIISPGQAGKKISAKKPKKDEKPAPAKLTTRLFPASLVLLLAFFVITNLPDKSIYHLANIFRAVYLSPMIKLSKVIETGGSAKKLITEKDLLASYNHEESSAGEAEDRGRVAGAFERNMDYFKNNGDSINLKAGESLDYFSSKLNNLIFLLESKLKGAYLAAANLWGDVKSGQDKYNLEKDLAEKRGAIVVPFKDEKSAEEIKQKIELMFSDEVVVQPDESGGSGIVKPVFGTEMVKQEYLYMMVPLNEEEK